MAIFLHFFARYGLLAILIGSGVEGEPFAIGGGMLALHMVVPFWLTMIAAAIGAFSIDQFWFAAGRHAGTHRYVRKLTCRPAFAASLTKVERHPVLSILLMRYAYGIRAIAPLAIGTTRMPTRQFVMLDAAAAVTWSLIYTTLGYGFADSASRIMGRAMDAGLLFAAALIIVLAIAFKYVVDKRAS